MTCGAEALGAVLMSGRVGGVPLRPGHVDAYVGLTLRSQGMGH